MSAERPTEEFDPTPTIASRLRPTENLRDQVEREVASAITAGVMRPGEVFSAPVLAARYGVSPTPVREAMLNLEKRGLVEVVRNVGFRVTDMGEAELRAIVDVRKLLEAPTVAGLAGQVTDTDLRRLRSLAQEIVTSAVDGDLRRYLEADKEFHLALLAMAGNPRLVKIVEDLRDQTRLPGLVGLVGTPELMRSAQEHHELLDLLDEGDESAAHDLILSHISHVLGWWAGQPERSDNPPVVPVLRGHQ